MAVGYRFQVYVQHPVVTVGEYRCARHDTGMSELNRTNAPIVIFPQKGMMMKHIRGREVPMDVNHAIFFNEAEPYRVTHPCGCGDRGTTFYLCPDVLREVLLDLDPEIEKRETNPFPFTHVPSDPTSYLQHRRIIHAVRNGTVDQVWLEETALDMLARTMRRPYELSMTQEEQRRAARRDGQRSTSGSMRADTRRAHADLVNATQTYLVGHHAGDLSLGEIARAVASSPYHLARVFRRNTGLTIHQYLTRLRLREAIDHLAGGEPNLTRLAMRLGFSSHSKFTEAFRREFNVTPSAFRAQCA